MKNVRPAFKVFGVNKEDLPIWFQNFTCHVRFDIKLGENFRRKARLLGGVHRMVAPASITYLSVVSRNLVRISLKVAALNYLDILTCNIQNAYLTAKVSRENMHDRWAGIWCRRRNTDDSEYGTVRIKVIRSSISSKVSWGTT